MRRSEETIDTPVHRSKQVFITRSQNNMHNFVNIKALGLMSVNQTLSKNTTEGLCNFFA